MSATGPSTPEPQEPEEEGLDPEAAPQMQVEPARLLANDARGRLHDLGFADEQIDSWAEAFIAEQGDGNVDDLVAWIAEQERG